MNVFHARRDSMQQTFLSERWVDIRHEVVLLNTLCYAVVFFFSFFSYRLSLERNSCESMWGLLLFRNRRNSDNRKKDGPTRDHCYYNTIWLRENCTRRNNPKKRLFTRPQLSFFYSLRIHIVLERYFLFPFSQDLIKCVEYRNLYTYLTD